MTAKINSEQELVEIKGLAYSLFNKASTMLDKQVESISVEDIAKAKELMQLYITVNNYHDEYECSLFTGTYARNDNFENVISAFIRKNGLFK
ncbi:MAG: hypothetical protein RR348_00570 [Clostridia bacterium]